MGKGGYLGGSTLIGFGACKTSWNAKKGRVSSAKASAATQNKTIAQSAKKAKQFREQVARAAEFEARKEAKVARTASKAAAAERFRKEKAPVFKGDQLAAALAQAQQREKI